MNKQTRKVLKKLNRQAFGPAGLEGVLTDMAIGYMVGNIQKRLSKPIVFQFGKPAETIDVPETDYKIID